MRNFLRTCRALKLNPNCFIDFFFLGQFFIPISILTANASFATLICQKRCIHRQAATFETETRHRGRARKSAESKARSLSPPLPSPLPTFLSFETLLLAPQACSSLRGTLIGDPVSNGMVVLVISTKGEDAFCIAKAERPPGWTIRNTPGTVFCIVLDTRTTRMYL